MTTEYKWTPVTEALPDAYTTIRVILTIKFTRLNRIVTLIGEDSREMVANFVTPGLYFPLTKNFMWDRPFELEDYSCWDGCKAEIVAWMPSIEPYI